MTWRPVARSQGQRTDVQFADGQVVFRTISEVDPVLEANKDLQSQGDGFSRSRDLRRVASIPVGVLAQWSEESGIDLQALPRKERQKFIFRKLRDPEWQHLRTSPGRI